MRIAISELVWTALYHARWLHRYAVDPSSQLEITNDRGELVTCVQLAKALRKRIPDWCHVDPLPLP